MKPSLLPPLCIDAIVKRMASELKAERLYRNLAIKCNAVGLFGAEVYFKHEAKDEAEHFGNLCEFLNDMGATYEVPDTPAVDVSSVERLIAMLNLAYETELELLGFYESLYKECNIDSMVIMQLALTFVEVQRKAVAGYADLIARLNQEGDIYAFDQYMSSLA